MGLVLAGSDRSVASWGSLLGRRHGTLASAIASLAIAFLVSAGLLWTGQEAPLPALGWAAVFLLVAVEEDVRTMRIPNWLTLPCLAGAIVLRVATEGFGGLESALAGVALAFAVLFVPFCLRWIGAGDVKALMVLGALWGSGLVLPVLWWMVVVGGVLGIALLLLGGGVLNFLRRWWEISKLSIASGRFRYLPPPADSPAARGLPFAVAMGLGAAAHQLWGSPWS